MKKHKILIIGGQGLLGKSLQNEFAKNELWDIYTFSRTKLKRRNHIVGSILIWEDVKEIIYYRFNLIINLSGQITNPIDECINLNSVGIMNLIELANSIEMCHVIHISSTCVYGSGHTMDETTIPNPDTPYATAKLVAEKLLIQDLKKEQLTIFRISNLYGKKQGNGIFPYLIKSSKTEMKLQFNNNGLLLRYYLNVDDCAMYITKLISLGYENLCGTFNLVGKERYTIKDLVMLFEKLKNVQFKVCYANIKPYDNAIEILDEKINRIIPFESSNSVQNYLINI